MLAGYPFPTVSKVLRNWQRSALLTFMLAVIYEI